MIQRSVSIAVGGALFALAAFSACAREARHVVPRRLDGALVRGAFVPPTAYEAFVRGELALAAGKYGEARAQFELATTAPEEDPLVLSRLAVAELRGGDRAAAARTIDYALELDGCSEAAWLARGELSERDGDRAAARRAYERATDCAPRSPLGELALARLLTHDAPGAALDVLVRAAARREYRSAIDPALQQALERAEPAALAHALTSLGVQRAPSTDATERAVRLALERDLPRLALRLASSQPGAIDPRLTAAIYERLAAQDELASLVAQYGADDLGGHRRAAELALAAGAYERAELEAESALAEAPSDGARATRARAMLGLERRSEASAVLREIRDPSLRRALALELLAAYGAPALSRELDRVGERANAQQ